MECSECGKFFVPGQSGETIQDGTGVCSECRPYRDQPTPLNSDMTMRNMPEPGMEDSGGNPLQEGILGDYQNRGVRDESFASVKKSNFWENLPPGNPTRMKFERLQTCQHIPEHQAVDEHGFGKCLDCGSIYSLGGDPEQSREQLEHPDPMMDNEPGTLKYPRHWGSKEDVSVQKKSEFDPNTILRILEYHLSEMEDHIQYASNDEEHELLTKEMAETKHQIEEVTKFVTAPLETQFNTPAIEHPLGPHMGSEEEPDFEVTQVIVPDPESIRPDKEQMAKKADFLGDLGEIGKAALPVAGGIAGGAVGTLLAPGVGTAAGAALGAGLAGGGASALGGGSVGQDVGTGLEDAAIGGIGGGLAGGALNAAGEGVAPALEGAVGEATSGGASVGTGAMEDAAAQGTTRGGVGSLMRSAWNKVPTSKLQTLYYGDKLIGGAANKAQQATQIQPQQNMMGAPPPSSLYSAVETPTSHGEIPSNDTSDPEEVDFHENEEDKPGLKDPSVNDIGGTDLGPDDFFSPDSGALASFAELLPKIIDFATSDKSAAGDPDMEELHQKLEAEKPGYMNTPDDDHGSKIIMMIMKGNPGEEDGDDSLQDNDKPHDPISEHEATALRPGLETICPMCGSVMDASTGNCPQCGMANARHMPQPTNPDFTTPQQMMNPPMQATAAGAMSQGPTTDEQKAKVAEVLQAENRAEEIPAMIIEPWNFADELSKITGQEEPPQDIGQPGPPPPATPPSQEGQMPMPGMSEGPQSGPSMQSAVRKYAATVDGFCEACPNCGSHSTGYLDYEEGKAGCKTCGHKWSAPKMVEHSSAGEDLHAAPEAPELSQVQPEEEQDKGSLSWTDESGMPLKVGQTYEMYSNNYDIPDRVKIDAVKPDVIEFTLVGEYGLSHRTKLTHEETSVEGTTFVPTEGEEFEQAPEENQGAQPMDPPPGQQTDLSTPHEMMSSTAAFWNKKQDPALLQDSMKALDQHYHSLDPQIKEMWLGMKQQELEKGELQRTPPPPGLTDGIAGGPQGVPPEQRVASPESINLEPNWEGMRAFVLQMARTDPLNAANINRELASEGVSPEELAAASGHNPQDLQATGEEVGQIRGLPEVQPPQGHMGSVLSRMGTAPPMDSHEIALAESSDADAQSFFETPESHVASLDPDVDSGITGPNWLMEGVTPSQQHMAGAHMSPWEQRGFIDESGDARNRNKLALQGTHYELDELNDQFLFGL